MSENAQWLLEQRYFVGGEKSFKELARRVARTIASAETEYGASVEWIRTLEQNITSDILNRRFLFNSPCLFSAAAGLTENVYTEPSEMMIEDYRKFHESRNENQQLFACFVIDVPDSLNGIFNSVRDAGIISKYGGGVGANFGNIREAGAAIAKGISGIASGPVSFMETWNTMGSVVVQGGKRRAALMGMMYDDHPDIESFIDCKTDDGRLSYFNISVAVSDELMEAAQNDGDFELHSRVDGSVVKTVKARELMRHICEAAWQRGDPGVFFIDRAQQDNLLKMGGEEWAFESTNPCGEQPLPNYTSCNLGSINLEVFVKDGAFDWSAFEAQVYRSFYYLDLVIDACSYPLPKIEQRTKAIRPVGLGLMGLADAAILMNIVYGSKEFDTFCETVASVFARTALLASIKIVTEMGKPAFPEHELVSELFASVGSLPRKLEEVETCFRGVIPDTLVNTLKEFTWDELTWILDCLYDGMLRTSRRLTIAPTGSISMLLDTSSSIEPNFAWSWSRRITKTDGSGFENREYWHKLLTPEARAEYAKTGHISNPVYVSAYDVSTHQHVKTVGIFAKYIDSAISKTVNLPNTATVEDVANVYRECYALGCKGITIYRDGSRSYQPIEIKKEVKERSGNIVFGKTIKDKTPWGNIFLTLNFDDGKPFETFINIGKSGSELKAMTEALARVLSISLRSGCTLENLIGTIKGLSGKEYWMLDCDDDRVVRSIPDAVAVLLEKLIDKETSGTSDKVCPECGAPLEAISGCEYCFSCGYSPCK